MPSLLHSSQIWLMKRCENEQILFPEGSNLNIYTDYELNICHFELREGKCTLTPNGSVHLMPYILKNCYSTSMAYGYLSPYEMQFNQYSLYMKYNPYYHMKYIIYLIYKSI